MPDPVSVGRGGSGVASAAETLPKILGLSCDTVYPFQLRTGSTGSYSFTIHKEEKTCTVNLFLETSFHQCKQKFKMVAF